LRLNGQKQLGCGRGRFLQGLRDTLQAAGVIIPPSTEKSFAREGEFLERALKKALLDREEALRDLARAARWVDRSAFGQQTDFAQAHQALLIALEKPRALCERKNLTQRRKGAKRKQNRNSRKKAQKAQKIER